MCGYGTVHAFPTIAILAGSPGALEIVVVFAAVLILFGPKRLPEIARSLGRMLDMVQRASRDFRAELMRIDQPTGPDGTGASARGAIPSARGEEAPGESGPAAAPAEEDVRAG